MICYGATIEWFKPKLERNYVNPVENVDYKIWVPNRQCVRDDGLPVLFEGLDNAENFEFLANYTKPTKPFDNYLFIENWVTKPTNQPHPDWPNYNCYMSYVELVPRSISDLIVVIKAKERESNNTLKDNGGYETACDYATMYAICKADNGIPCDEMVTAKTRLSQIVERTQQNAARATELIRKVKLGEAVVINEGWYTDTLTPLGSPFNDDEYAAVNSI